MRNTTEIIAEIFQQDPKPVKVSKMCELMKEYTAALLEEYNETLK